MTNYADTFIRVASDSPAEAAQVPRAMRLEVSTAQLQYELLIGAYAMASDDLIFAVFAIRRGISNENKAKSRLNFLPGLRHACALQPFLSGMGGDSTTTHG